MECEAVDTSGYAMRASKTGRVVGFAFEAFDGQKTQEGTVLCFVNPHTWVNPEEHEKMKSDLEDLKKQMSEIKALRQARK